MDLENKKKQLTKAELHYMNIIWDKGGASVNDIMDVLSSPKPAYTTVLTIMQVLTRKQIVEPQRCGKMHVFKPLLSRDEYISSFIEETRDTLFKGSMRNFLSYFVKSEKISPEELSSLLEEMQKD
ncbi:MAG: BlaI/MecI/CopY family transcriptional regulator [Bacteroidaceae bacterium]|nr:BlaI/MecI/CopY family transcriptional regulator [Bacteroidaceae bacterium]